MELQTAGVCRLLSLSSKTSDSFLLFWLYCSVVKNQLRLRYKTICRYPSAYMHIACNNIKKKNVNFL